MPFFAFSLSQMRAKVWKARTTSTLFNVRQYCADMEQLLHRMWKRYADGLAPEHILSENNFDIDV